MKFLFLAPLILLSLKGISQSFDTAAYSLAVTIDSSINNFFTKDPFWRGGDGASSIDLGNGKVLWLFGDSFIAKDSFGTRSGAPLIRNSIAIQNGYNPENASIKYYYTHKDGKPTAFFEQPGKSWFWPGHGVKIKNKLLIFLMRERAITSGLGFETDGWDAVLISNPMDDPEKWKIKYINVPDTYGTVAGSAAIVKQGNYIYAYGAVEPGTHEVYLLRWKSVNAYKGDLSKPHWWINGKWVERKSKNITPSLLFTGSTEYSVHYDSFLKKFIQFQSFGFGESRIGIRVSASLHGPWSEPYLFYLPDYAGFKKPFMYSAKAHPELTGGKKYITYNINSFDFEELLNNQTLYFPRFVLLKIVKKN